MHGSTIKINYSVSSETSYAFYFIFQNSKIPSVSPNCVDFDRRVNHVERLVSSGHKIYLSNFDLGEGVLSGATLDPFISQDIQTYKQQG